MGIDPEQLPPLPAPTETETESNLHSDGGSDLGTDVTTSRPTEIRSSYSLPDDGTPLTIKTRGHKHNRSQTSLLIEYFDTGKAERKPSVRVRLTPSSKNPEKGQLRITRTKGQRKSVESRSFVASGLSDDDTTIRLDNASSLVSSNTGSNLSYPVGFEVERSHRRFRRPTSPLIPTSAAEDSVVSSFRSDVSAIPSDSFLDGSSGHEGKYDLPTASGSYPPYRAPEKMSSREKSSGKDRTSSKSRDKEKRHKSSSTRIRSERHGEGSRTSRRSSRTHQDSLVSGADSSVVSSVVSGGPRTSALSTVSGASGASGTSINNPKLLETVEEAIRRLILPELTALKREQSKKGARPDSLTESSLTSTSRDSRDSRDERRRSSKSTANRDSARYHEPRNREARNDIDETVALREEDNVSLDFDHENRRATPRSRDGKSPLAGPKSAAALGTAAALVTGAIDKQPSDLSQPRRRRRAEKRASAKTTAYAHNESDVSFDPPAPPMPLCSEINPSELTRTSILSANSEVSRLTSDERSMSRNGPGAGNTTSAQVNSLAQLGAAHANISHGDLKQLPSRRTGELPKATRTAAAPVQEEEYYDDDDENGDGESYRSQYPQYSGRDIPAPLNYVPYQPGYRELSPIESVSGYTDGHSEVHYSRDSRLIQPTGSPTPGRPDEAVSNISSVRAPALDESELGSWRSSGVNAYRNSTLTEDSELDRVQSGQAVQVVGANPKLVNCYTGIESNVASLVEPSVVEPSVLSRYHQQRHQQQSANKSWESIASSENQMSRSAADSRGANSLRLGSVSPVSRDVSPVKRDMNSASPSVASRRQLFEERLGSPASRKSLLSREYQEYEPDVYGHKIPVASGSRRRTESPTPSESVIASAAVGAAAAALQAAKNKKGTSGGTDIVRNKSFKEHAQSKQPAATPKHSIDRFSVDEPRMYATAGPDLSMPALGYGLDDHSVVDTPIAASFMGDRAMDRERRDENATPTPGNTETASPVRELSQADSVDFTRTSQDRKRETIITNPYGNSSPVAMLPAGSPAGAASFSVPPYSANTPALLHKPDAGYLSQGIATKTPNVVRRKSNGEVYGADGFPRRMSGVSHGMDSPIYDGSTGTGIERIENKDIVALMQHLMVRDAQRSARDTEILVTLVRTAADMRTSFDAVTKLLGDVENTIITEVQDNTDKTVRTHLGGPRPYPGSATNRAAIGTQSATDDAAKKRGFLKKALKSLSSRGHNDLGRIEEMLNHLLSEVDVLREQNTVQANQRAAAAPQPSVDAGVRREHAEGNSATTSSTSRAASQAAYMSSSQRAPASQGGFDRLQPDNYRINVVQERESEDDEDENEHNDDDDDDDGRSTPRPEHYRTTHGNTLEPAQEWQPESVRRQSPMLSMAHPTSAGALPVPQQELHTPLATKEKGKKHKSGSSSNWIPKISRWSETTTSSIVNKFRMSGSSKRNQDDEYPQHPAPIRSQSDFGATYDADGFLRTDGESDRVQLNTGSDLHGPMMAPPHPSTYMTPEDPKYHAHRNSVNLHHPQPRPGNTEKHQLALESSAQNYAHVSMSPRSGAWPPSTSSLGNYADGSHAASAGHEYWAASSVSPQGPPLPPKEPIDHSSVGTASMSKLPPPSGLPAPYRSVESGYGTATTGADFTSPKMENRHLSTAVDLPTRRPSGPRAMTPKSPGLPEENRRIKRDTFGTAEGDESAYYHSGA